MRVKCCLGIIIINLSRILCVPIATFNLNKYLPYNMSFTSSSDPEPECLFARGNFSVKPRHTICYRYKAHSYAGPSKPGYVDLLQFGRKKENVSDITEGYLWGTWPIDDVTSNNWIGFPIRRTPVYAWKQLPPFKDHFIINVWKHQCLSIDFSTGEFKYILNGKPIYAVKNIFDDFTEELDPFSDYFDFLSVGCAFQTTGSKVKSLVGQFTDLQMFGSVLDERQMIAYTSCKEYMKGDLLSWDDIPWVLGGRRQLSELEYLDLEKDICIPLDSSLILLPFPLKKEPHAEQMCAKLSSSIASYSNQEDVELIGSFLASKNNLNENGCTTRVSDNEFLITAGVDGKLAGEIFVNPSTGGLVSLSTLQPTQ